LDEYTYLVSGGHGGTFHHEFRARWVHENVRCLFPAVAIGNEEATVVWPAAGDVADMALLPSFHVVLCRSIQFAGDNDKTSFAVCSCRSPSGKAGVH
jgi:hypothetical protein